MRIEVKAGQDLLDVAVQYTGYAYNAYPIADANELAITDDLDKTQETDMEDTKLKH